MEKFSDLEIIKELSERLKAKDKANCDLVAMARKLEELNNKLLESEKVKSSFLSNIRNEINNPLTSVLTMSEILISNDEMPDAEMLKSVISLIYKEAFTLNFQLRNIFAAAELEAGEASPGISNADMASVLRDSVNSFQHRAVEKRILIKLGISNALKDGLFRTDAEKVHRVFSNLLSNAIEYSPEDNEITITVLKDGGRLNISVKDNGAGIDRADQKLIFERFRQIETGATKTHGGHGLGLSIVKATLDLLGGEIRVESERGSGAEFTVSIPEAAEGNDEIFSIHGTDFFTEAGSERF